MKRLIRERNAKRTPKVKPVLALPSRSFRGYTFSFWFIFLTIAGCGRSSPPTKPALIVISGDTDGWIVPCGCTANQSGGLLRRGTYLNDLRKTADLIYADAGGATSGDSPYQQAKLEAILRGEKIMGITAHNLGKSELVFGPDALRDLATKTGVTFISANTRAADGQPLAPPLIIVPLNGRRIALIGVVDPTYATKQITVDDPRSAIKSAIVSHKGEFDSLIVLAYMPQDELSKLADALPEADAVVGEAHWSADRANDAGPRPPGRRHEQREISRSPASSTSQSTLDRNGRRTRPHAGG